MGPETDRGRYHAAASAGWIFYGTITRLLLLAPVAMAQQSNQPAPEWVLAISGGLGQFFEPIQEGCDPCSSQFAVDAKTIIVVRSKKQKSGVQVDVSLENSSTKLGSALIQSDQPATFDIPGAVGTAPLEIRLVPNKRVLASAPEVVNRTTSLQVESLDPQLTHCRLMLRNTSWLNLTAIAIEVQDQEGRMATAISSLAPTPAGLVTAGKVAAYYVFWPAHGQVTSQGLLPDETRPWRIVITGALLGRTRIEGDGDEAAKLIGVDVGSKLQRARIRETLDVPASEQQIAKAVETLAVEPSPKDVDTVLADYPAFGEANRKALDEGLRRGFRSERSAMQNQLRAFDRSQAEDPAASLKEFLRKLSSRL